MHFAGIDVQVDVEHNGKREQCGAKDGSKQAPDGKQSGEKPTEMDTTPSKDDTQATTRKDTPTQKNGKVCFAFCSKTF